MTQKIKLRNDLNADALFSQVRPGFEKIPDHRSKNSMIYIHFKKQGNMHIMIVKIKYLSGKAQHIGYTFSSAH